MLNCQNFYLLYDALNRGQSESYKKALLIRKCFGNYMTEFSFPSNLNFNLLSRTQGAYILPLAEIFVVHLVFKFISYFFRDICCGAVAFAILLINLFSHKFSFHVSLSLVHSFV